MTRECPLPGIGFEQIVAARGLMPPREKRMSKGEQKSNREAKKPKSEKNKSKGKGTPPHLMQQANAPIVNQKKK